MTLTVVRKGERIPTPSVEKDGTQGGWVRRQAECDGVMADGPGCFITREQLEEALRALGKR